jgi:hypothetical protein
MSKIFFFIKKRIFICIFPILCIRDINPGYSLLKIINQKMEMIIRLYYIILYLKKKFKKKWIV